MDALAIGVVVVAVLAASALTVSWFVQRHPEHSDDHDITRDEAAGPTGTRYPPRSRPGGPGAEGTAVHEPGDTAPGVPGASTPRITDDATCSFLPETDRVRVGSNR